MIKSLHMMDICMSMALLEVAAVGMAVQAILLPILDTPLVFLIQAYGPQDVLLADLAMYILLQPLLIIHLVVY
jgi:hypothetical protein